MKVIVVSVFDEKASAYMTPIFVANVNLGRRAFGDAVLNPESGLSKHASDFHLYQVGVFDDNKGVFEHFDKPEFLANATDFLNKGVSDGQDKKVKL